ncbi:MAG: tRNA uridine-5-carboxymethylaminomethyl(34) synthesis GTPase MnmE [Firmicutes bacterium]|nr:tRNA uridine-5-carboxymethylaminomethyl(34) synthesis GTPase MnmE [Bacillota bacterium]
MIDTIAAISTPLGEGGIGVIRVSGPDAVEIVDKVFVPAGKGAGYLKTVPSHTVHYGHIITDQGDYIDEVLVTVMRAPRTYTREDTVEISCHGGITPVRAVLERVLEAGARLAEPGEFTKRAFLNGRIDLAQAEAVIDIIRSKTRASQEIALRNLHGELSQRVTEIRESLLQALMYLEASIDFPEDEIPPLEEDLGVILKTIKQRLEELIDTARTGRVYREGLATVIAGKPNVGKSSLLNALVQEERAIVTNIPGTTRDLLEVEVNLNGLPLRIIDTAGIRLTHDEVEKIGVARSKQALERADIILFLVDVAEGTNEEDFHIAEVLPPEKTILVGNKIDEGKNVDLSALFRRFGAPVFISAQEKTGLDKLKEAIISKAALLEISSAEVVFVTNVRHLDALRRAKEAVEAATHSHQEGLAADFITIDLHAAVDALGEITGDSASDDLVNRIFASFCIGK